MRKFFGFLLDFFQEGFLNCILRVLKTIWREFFSSNFFIVFGHWTKIFRASVEFFLRACQNCIVSIQKNILSSKKSWGFQGFWAVSDFEQKTFGFLSKLFRRDCQICILRVQRNTLKKNLFFENFLPLVFFGPWEESFRHSGNNFQKVLWKLLSTCPWDNLEETFLLEILCFWSSLENESKVLRLLSTFPIWKLKLLFTCLWDLFQQTYVSEETVFPPFGKNFRKCCEICFIPVHGIISRKNLFSTKIFFWYDFFGQGAKFCGLLANLSDMVVTTAFYLPMRKLWRKTFFKENCFLSFSDNERIFPAFCQNFPARLSKLHFACP